MQQQVWYYGAPFVSKLVNYHGIINKSLLIKIIVDLLLIYGAPFVSELNAFNGIFNML